MWDECQQWERVGHTSQATEGAAVQVPCQDHWDLQQLQRWHWDLLRWTCLLQDATDCDYLPVSSSKISSWASTNCNLWIHLEDTCWNLNLAYGIRPHSELAKSPAESLSLLPGRPPLKNITHRHTHTHTSSTLWYGAFPTFAENFFWNLPKSTKINQSLVDHLPL